MDFGPDVLCQFQSISSFSPLKKLMPDDFPQPGNLNVLPVNVFLLMNKALLN